jgi:TIR domain
VNNRDVIFISHANPEDNAFTIWLGAKLSVAGYEVWADVLRLRGGQDWQRALEDAIRNRACRVLLAANEYSVNKQGVRNEIQIASDVARRIKDDAFIIPLRLGRYDAPFLIAQAQYINFEQGWMQGLAELLQVLEETCRVPKSSGNINAWLDVQLMHGKELTVGPEWLLSSWLEVRRVPTHLYFHSQDESTTTPICWPTVQYGNGILTFAKGEARNRLSQRTSDLLRFGWPKLGLTVDDARRRFADLVNQAMADLLQSKNLQNYEMANRQLAWWVPATGPQSRISFKWPRYHGSRQIQGVSTKRNIRWHFGISTSFRAVPFYHIRLKSRLIFTEDGHTPITSTARAHRLRRSFAKGWRNARWRDMLLSFLFWIADGTTVLDVPVAADDALVLTLPPTSFSCPAGIRDALDESQSDEDDPDIEFLNDEDLVDEGPEQE